MKAASHYADEQLLASLQAPPDIREGVQSLGYWRERSRRLPWYRVRARQEAMRMTGRWEQRVRVALVRQSGVPIAIRASAGLLVARIRVRRWARRAAVALVAIFALALLATPAIGAMVFLLNAL